MFQKTIYVKVLRESQTAMQPQFWLHLWTQQLWFSIAISIIKTVHSHDTDHNLKAFRVSVTAIVAISAAIVCNFL